MSTLNYNRIHFLTSAAKLFQCPPDLGAEVAFAGRSNAGKSSALNAIAGIRRLAKTSKTPGRTQLINFFELTPDQRLVDLPGYGYAKVPIEIKLRWGKLLSRYVSERESLKGIILLMDIRHPLTPFDWDMINWTNTQDMPIHILLTKADKLKRGAALNALLATQKALKDYGSISLQLFSAVKKEGLEEAYQKLNEWLTLSA